MPSNGELQTLESKVTQKLLKLFVSRVEFKGEELVSMRH